MWEKISSKVLFKHLRLTVVEDIVQLPNGKQVPYLRFDARTDSVVIICVRNDEVLLQREYSYPTNKVLYQFPGGKVEANETLFDGAKRELREEAGLAPSKIEQIGWFYPDNRRSSAKMNVFLASDLKPVRKKGGDLEEDITSHWITWSELRKKIAVGEICNYSVLSAWAIYISKKLSKS